MPTYNTVAEAEQAFAHKQKFDENGRTIELCQDCDKPVEVHPYGGAGYVSPESTEVPVQTPTGVHTVAQQKTVCKACHDAAFERVYGTKSDATKTPQE